MTHRLSTFVISRRSINVLAGTLAAIGLVGAGCQSGTTPAVEPAAKSATASEARYAVIKGERAEVPAIRMGDEETIARIIDEGVNRNQVMDHLSHLSLEIGTRLTGSTACEEANRWTASKFREWGLSNVSLDQWGEVATRFDRGPSTGAVLLARPKRGGRGAASEGEGEEAAAPEMDYLKVRDVQFTTLAWVHGTSGPTRGHVVRMPESVEEFESVKDTLRGAWVLRKAIVTPGRTDMRGVGSSMSDRVLAMHAERTGLSTEEMGIRERDAERFESLRDDLQPYLEAGILGFVSSSRDDRVWTTSVRRWRETKAEDAPRDLEVSMSLPDYDYVNSRLADEDDVFLEFNLPHTLTTGPFPVYNTVAEIPGTDKADEVIIVSGHLDSWDGPGSQGTTDNGTGSSVTLEAARILMAAGAKPRRTIRFVLWTGEEQGLLGSASYVERHADQLPKISAVFVDDGGTNYQGGLGCTDTMAPMLAAATAPVNGLFFDSVDGKPLNVNIRPGGEDFQQSGGSDHASFVRKGVPGFFWDEIGRAEYGRGWHTQFDTMSLAIPEYLKQAATSSAITAYNLACADELLPRWEMKEPAAPRQPGGGRREGGGERPAAQQN
jgi:hypothetical protein